MEKKLCWYCSHFDYQSGTRWYSDETPGMNFSISCDMNKWDFDPVCSSQEGFAKCLETAEHCVEFKTQQERLVDEIKGYMKDISGWRHSVESVISELDEKIKMIEKHLGIEK